MVWTVFWDQGTDGRRKEKWLMICIEAHHQEAIPYFKKRFGHDPQRVTCQCCGQDYSIHEANTLSEATHYERTMEAQMRWRMNTGNTHWGMHRINENVEPLTVEEYQKTGELLVIRRFEMEDS
jgi:hypothetical protein